MVFDSLLNPVFSPLLKLHPFLAIFIISFVITLAITLVYKYTTDQARMRELKKRVKDYQEKMKKSRDNPEKVLKLQKESMGFNLELMKHSFKPTLYTLIPIIIIFGWLNAHMAYYNLAPEAPFTVTAELADGYTGAVALEAPEGMTVLNQTREGATVAWTLSASSGTYDVRLVPENAEAVTQTVLVTEEREYEAPVRQHKDGVVRKVVTGNERVTPLDPLSLLGWHPGWLGTYILLSILLSFGVRKALNVV